VVEVNNLKVLDCIFSAHCGLLYRGIHFLPYGVYWPDTELHGYVVEIPSCTLSCMIGRQRTDLICDLRPLFNHRLQEKCTRKHN
jgi:hypothetical protein